MDSPRESGRNPSTVDVGYCTICKRQFKGRAGLSSHNGHAHSRYGWHKKPIAEPVVAGGSSNAFGLVVAAGPERSVSVEIILAPTVVANPRPPELDVSGASSSNATVEKNSQNSKKRDRSLSLTVVSPKILRHAPVNEPRRKECRIFTYIVDEAAYQEPQFAPKLETPLVAPSAMAESPFHSRTCTLLKTPLKASISMGVNRTMQCAFTVSSVYRIPGKCLLIRLCSNPSQLYPSDKRPHNLALSLNGKDILRPANIDYRPTLKYHHAYSPIEVELKDAPESNKLTIEWTVADSKSLTEDFFLFLEISEKKCVESICGDVSKRKLGIDESASKLYRDLTKQDDEISGSSRTLNLICDLSQRRPEIPAKGKNCRHLDCFDLASFIQMNQALNAKWSCPVCKAPISFSDLVIDEFIRDLLKEFPYSKVIEVSAGDEMIIVKEQKKPEVKMANLIEAVNVDEAIICL